MDDKKVSKNVKSNRALKVLTLLTKFLLIMICVFLMISFFAIIFYYTYIENKREEIAQTNTNAIIGKDEIIEYGTTLKYEDILQKLVATSNLSEETTLEIYLNDHLLTQNDEYTFNTLDEITFTVKTSKDIIPFFNQKVLLNKKFIWAVQDTIKPVLLGVQDREITEGETFDAKSGISAKDEIDGDLEVIVDGEFDVNKPGEYVLIAKAVDKNQNEVSQNFKLTVKAKPATTPTTTNSNTSNKKGNSSTSNKNNASTNKNTNNNSNADPTSTASGRLSLAKAEASRVVSQIISPGMTKLQKAEAICNYITTTVSAQTNQSDEAYKTNYGNEAYAALIMKIAACSGRCKAVTLLCQAAGLNSQHINQGQWTHQWNKIQIDDGSWVVVDSQIGFVGDKHPLED